MKSMVLTVGALLVSAQFASAETVLFDSQGFENDPPYTVGKMADLTDKDGWTLIASASTYTEIESGVPDYGTVMHMYNNAHGAVYQSVDVQSGLLTVSFDVKSLTSESRTLILEVGNNVTAGNTSPGDLASYIGWGASANRLSYLGANGGGWTTLMDGAGSTTPWTLDTNWHHVEVVYDLENKTYDLNLDGGTVELADQGWYSAFDPSTKPINRVMFMAWGTGVEEVGFMVDNVVISQVPEPSTFILLGVALCGLSLAWRRQR